MEPSHDRRRTRLHAQARQAGRLRRDLSGHGLQIQLDYLGAFHGYFTSEIDELNHVWLVVLRSLDDRQARRARMSRPALAGLSRQSRRPHPTAEHADPAAHRLLSAALRFNDDHRKSRRRGRWHHRPLLGRRLCARRRACHGLRPSARGSRRHAGALCQYGRGIRGPVRRRRGPSGDARPYHRGGQHRQGRQPRRILFTNASTRSSTASARSSSNSTG